MASLQKENCGPLIAFGFPLKRLHEGSQKVPNFEQGIHEPSRESEPGVLVPGSPLAKRLRMGKIQALGIGSCSSSRLSGVFKLGFHHVVLNKRTVFVHAIGTRCECHGTSDGVCLSFWFAVRTTNFSLGFSSIKSLGSYNHGCLKIGIIQIGSTILVLGGQETLESSLGQRGVTSLLRSVALWLTD